MSRSPRHGRVPIPRRLRQNSRGIPPAGPGAIASRPSDVEPPGAAGRVDSAFALTRREAEEVVRVADRQAGLGHASPATPDRLRAAVEVALGDATGGGSVLVTRLPRALHSPETWHVRLVAVPPVGRDRVSASIHSARLACARSTEGAGDVR
jgi:hypothetical protein